MAKAAAMLFFFSFLSSCEGNYDELPPKTDQAPQYAIPDPVYPTQDEIDLLKAIREEHNTSTNQ